MPAIYYLSNEENDLTSDFNEWKIVYSGTSAGTPSPLPRTLLGQVSTQAHPSVKIASLDTSSGATIGLPYNPFSTKSHHWCFRDDSINEVKIQMSFHDPLLDSEHKETLRHRVTEASSHELLALQHAANTKNFGEFARLADHIKWFRYPEAELTRAIDLALMLDMVLIARELARKGRNLFPRDKHIQQAVSVLSPPFSVRTSPARTTNVELSQQWLREHSSRYKGEWVAVRAGILLGSAPTLRELHEQIGLIDRTPETLIVKVLS
jgi:hypothetical protein